MDSLGFDLGVPSANAGGTMSTMNMTHGSCDAMRKSKRRRRKHHQHRRQQRRLLEPHLVRILRASLHLSLKSTTSQIPPTTTMTLSPLLCLANYRRVGPDGVAWYEHPCVLCSCKASHGSVQHILVWLFVLRRSWVSFLRLRGRWTCLPTTTMRLNMIRRQQHMQPKSNEHTSSYQTATPSIHPLISSSFPPT